MKKIIAIALALLMVLSFAACGAKENANTENDTSFPQGDVQTSVSKQDTKPDDDAVSSTDWPTNTIFPKPEGCKIIEIKSESYKNYITVEWDGKDAAKQYIEIVKTVEGDSAEVISQGETDDTIYYGTYGITITSMNEAENIVLYK